MLMLGVVTEVGEVDVVLSLPNGLTGFIRGMYSILNEANFQMFTLAIFTLSYILNQYDFLHF